jgi:hypothetical protein
MSSDAVTLWLFAVGAGCVIWLVVLLFQIARELRRRARVRR